VGNSGLIVEAIDLWLAGADTRVVSWLDLTSGDREEFQARQAIPPKPWRPPVSCSPSRRRQA